MCGGFFASSTALYMQRSVTHARISATELHVKARARVAIDITTRA